MLEDTSRRLKDLRTVAPNMLDMAPLMTTRDIHNHAPELGATPKKRPSTAIVWPNEPDYGPR